MAAQKKPTRPAARKTRPGGAGCTWVCFHCHFVKREPKYTSHVPKCAECGADCDNLGHHLRVPAKTDRRGWRALQALCRKGAMQSLKKKSLDQTRSKHWLEREIARMEALAENRDRRRRINVLKKRLTAFVV